MQKSVLVVDDNPVLLSQMTRLLEAEGHRVATAKDGFTALNMLTSLTPDVAFIDLIMPNIGGDSLCRLIRKMPHLRDCFLVVVSAAVVEQEFDYRRIGADACIAKGPFDLMQPHVLSVIADAGQIQPPAVGEKIRGIETVAVRRITQELLSKSRHLETVLESIPEGVVEILEGKVIYANSPAADIFETPLEDLLGKGFTSLFPRQLRERIDSLLEVTPPGEIGALGQDRPLNLPSSQISLTCIALAEVGTRLVILTDVTRTKSVERALKEAMEYSENILNTMADSLVVLKPDLSINFINRATCSMLEYSPHDLFGKQIDGLFFEPISFEKEMFSRLIQDEGVTEPNLAYKTRSGKRIPVSFLASPMYENRDDQRKLLGVICIAHDIREVEQLQQQLFHAEKIASFGVLAAGVAHEIKNPLAVTLQGLETLQALLPPGRGVAAASDTIERIRKATMRANKIVEGLLDYSRQTAPEFVEADLLEVLRESVSLVEHNLRTSRIEVVERPASGSHRVQVDVNQIKQVFINILVNAAEAMPEGGTLTLETELGKGGGKGAWVRVMFTDTGPGMAPDILQRVTEPFFSTKTKSLNTGLGLSVSQGILDRHRGNLRFESEPGKGTRVILTLPAEEGGDSTA
ncbi:MAG: ATP-binding protein [Desulfobacterales bacterium]|jgi:PAS domain S-box-containing protein